MREITLTLRRLCVAIAMVRYSLFARKVFNVDEQRELIFWNERHPTTKNFT